MQFRRDAYIRTIFEQKTPIILEKTNGKNEREKNKRKNTKRNAPGLELASSNSKLHPSGVNRWPVLIF